MTTSYQSNLLQTAVARALGATLLACALIAPAGAAQQASYPTPEAAASALVDAVSRHDRKALATILGQRYAQVLPPDLDEQDVQVFLAAWQQKHSFSEPAPGQARLQVGPGEWAFPIPLKQAAAGWRFDLQAGEQEIRTRAIGRNELNAIQAALAYVDAQREYAQLDRNGDGVLQYAERFVSSKGEHDGLYWPSAEGEAPSPLGAVFSGSPPRAKTNQQVASGSGYHGYRFRILKAQGPHARGGAYSYVGQGRMNGGFALLAWPAKWGQTGVQSFIVNQDGQVFQRDLGSRTSERVGGIKAYDPGPDWQPVSTEDLQIPLAKP